MKVIKLNDVIINLERVEYIEQFPADKKTGDVIFGFHFFENKYVAVSANKVVAPYILDTCLKIMREE